MADTKTISLDQLKQHTASEDLWLLIDGKGRRCEYQRPRGDIRISLYDVSKFMDEHPGGDEVLLTEAGKDATEAFEDVGHSDDARALLGPMLVGEIQGGSSATTKKATSASTNQAAQKSGNPLLMFIPLMILGAYVAYRFVS